MDTLVVQGIRKQFGGIQAIRSLSFACQPGTITGLIGPNGSGKSTLVELLTGGTRHDGGRIEINQTILPEQFSSRQIAGYGMTRTFQEVHIFEQLTVRENILVVLTARGVIAALRERVSLEAHRETQVILEHIHLADHAEELASHLSYGQRKLLEIGRALAMQRMPGYDIRIFFFDEPFAGLFPEVIKLVTALLEELRATGATILLIEHDMALIQQLCDRVIVLDVGCVLAAGTAKEVLTNPAVIEAYLGYSYDATP